MVWLVLICFIWVDTLLFGFLWWSGFVCGGGLKVGGVGLVWVGGVWVLGWGFS